MIERLRGSYEERPSVDPGLAGGLREWLEDGLAGAVSQLPATNPPVLINRGTLARVLGQPRPAGDDEIAHDREGADHDGADHPDVNASLALGALVHALFHQVLTSGRPVDGLDDGLAALAVRDPNDRVIEFVDRLSAEQRRALALDVDSHLAQIVEDWSVLPAAWLPRTRARVAVPLAGGRVLLTGLLDVAIGAPSQGRASECIIVARTGTPRPEHRDDLGFLVLLETIRSGAAPWRAATYYTATGDLRVDDITDELLAQAVDRTLGGGHLLCAQTHRPGADQWA